MFPRTPVALPPSSATAASSSAGRRPVTTTFAPSATNRFAVASPIPLVPPVTRAILPASFCVMVGSPRWYELCDRCRSLPHGLHRVVGRQDRVRHEAVVDQRRLVSVAGLWVAGAGRRVLHHGHLEALL